MNSIPLDLIQEIFSRLPVKPIGRCRCVSKQWRSIICGQDFTELFLTRSSARPRLLFAIEGFKNGVGEWHFFSSPPPHSPYDEKSSSLVIAADYHTKFPGNLQLNICGYASGLICFFHYTRIPNEVEVEDIVHVICNPSTGQRASLPELTEVRNSKSFLGFDPIDKQFKVLVMAKNCYRILTLGTGEMSWRKIQCPLTHHPDFEGICINGVLYYWAFFAETSDAKIACFDVRSEKFKFLDAEFTCDRLRKLINNKGKLCVITWKSRYDGSESGTREPVWVLEDFEKQEWSKYAYTLPNNELAYTYGVDLVGVTATGEIVFADPDMCNPFHVFYLNSERNILQVFEIQGNHQVINTNFNRVYTFLDHVEDLKFNITKTIPSEQKPKPTSTSTASSKAQLQQDPRTFDVLKTTYAASSISPPEQKPKPTSTSTSSSKAHLQQDRRTFDGLNTTYAASSMSPPEQKPKPTSTSTSFITPMALAILFFFWVFFSSRVYSLIIIM